MGAIRSRPAFYRAINKLRNLSSHDRTRSPAYLFWRFRDRHRMSVAAATVAAATDVQDTLGANDFELSGHARARGRVEEWKQRVEEAAMISLKRS